MCMFLCILNWISNMVWEAKKIILHYYFAFDSLILRMCWYESRNMVFFTYDEPSSKALAILRRRQHLRLLLVDLLHSPRQFFDHYLACTPFPVGWKWVYFNGFMEFILDIKSKIFRIYIQFCGQNSTKKILITCSCCNNPNILNLLQFLQKTLPTNNW